MHEVAVIILCVLVGQVVWHDVAELLIAWYSGAEPALTNMAKTMLWSRTAIAVAAGATALVTL